jgi:signal peptidase I
MRIRRSSALLVVLAAALIAGWFFTLRPASLGGLVTYVMVRGGSMEPTLHGGDLVVVRRQGSYGPGDIVAFRVPKGDPGEGAIVVHRIAGGSPEEGFTMQGDNMHGADVWQPSQNDIVGKMWFSVPGGGRLLERLRAPLPLAALAASIAVFLVLSGPEKEKRPRQPAPPSQGPPASRAAPRHRLRLPPGPTLFLLLALLPAGVAAVSFSAWQ